MLARSQRARSTGSQRGCPRSCSLTHNVLSELQRAPRCLVLGDDVPPLTRKKLEPAPFPNKPGAPALIPATVDTKSLTRHNDILCERARSTVLARSFSSWTMYHRCRESSLRCTTVAVTPADEAAPSQHQASSQHFSSGMAATAFLQNRQRELAESLGRFIRVLRARSILSCWLDPRTEDSQRHAIRDRLLAKIEFMDQAILQGKKVLDVDGPAWEVGSAQ